MTDNLNPSYQRIHPSEAELVRSCLSFCGHGNCQLDSTVNQLMLHSAVWPELKSNTRQLSLVILTEVAPLCRNSRRSTSIHTISLEKRIKLSDSRSRREWDHGRVIIRFVVDKEGNVVNPKVVRSVDPYLDKEALRIINQMPKWKPGELEDGTKVAVYFTVPVMFRAQ